MERREFPDWRLAVGVWLAAAVAAFLMLPAM